MPYSNFLLLFSLSLLPLSLALYGDPRSDPPSPTSSASVAATSTFSTIEGVHIIRVGENSLTFSPADLRVPPGDTVEFHFWPQAHSVAQSSFVDPCTPLNQTDGFSVSGFFSGPIAVDSEVSDTVFSIRVESSSPVWYYCATERHCQSGMVGLLMRRKSECFCCVFPLPCLNCC